MSLVGSLEDLGLGEILQIVSLSGKSGVLQVRSSEGEGRILFRQGMIHGAFVKEGPVDLRALLAEAEVLPEAELAALCEDARADGTPLEALLLDRSVLDADRLDEIRRAHIEATVYRMFVWGVGEFSFEIRDDEARSGDEELLLRTGMNAQFLALEGTRMRDERRHEETIGAQDAPAAEPVELDSPTELTLGPLERLDESDDVRSLEPVDREEASWDEEPTVGGRGLIDEDPVTPLPPPPQTPAPLAPRRETGATDEDPITPLDPRDEPPPVRETPVVAIDPELAVLEWIKNSLTGTAPRIHVFQRSEQAIARVRQYVVRGEIPLVLLTTESPADPVSGASGWSEIAARLRAQVARIPLVLLASPRAPISPTNERAIPDSVTDKPDMTVLSDERAVERRGALGAALSHAIQRARERQASPDAGDDAAGLRALKQATARLRSPAASGDVLRVVMEFAAREFDRIAMFRIGDGHAQGVAQAGLAEHGGPDDDTIGALRIPLETTGWLRGICAERSPRRAAPTDAGDQDLARQLGGPAASRAYVAPIEGSGDPVALLYADNLPTGRPLPDTSALEVLLHEAALALEQTPEPSSD